MDALAPAPVDAAEIGQEPEALLKGRTRAAEKVGRQPIVSRFDVRPIAPEQLVQIAHHLLQGRQRAFDLRRLHHRRREALGQAGVAVEPGDAGRLAEIVGDALEPIHGAFSPYSGGQDMGRGLEPDQTRARRSGTKLPTHRCGRPVPWHCGLVEAVALAVCREIRQSVQG
jgi:hypothetical protein